jgi:DNA (cytosine-5)-methyltransferase 1
MLRSVVRIHDHFAGCGGNSQGVLEAGAEVSQAINHDARAVETYAANHRNTDVIQTDLLNADPRDYPGADVLIASPECRMHGPSRGKKQLSKQWRLWEDDEPETEEEARSRMTMRDVIRFSDVHRYKLVIVENVVEVRKWPFYGRWLDEMVALGYRYRENFLNAQFFDTPQSRDRIYIVFWREGQRAPDLDFRPRAYCAHCDLQIDAIQSWKRPGRIGGKYGRRNQYVYRCPRCTAEVFPYYRAAGEVIDWSIPIPKVGERDRPLANPTIARLEAGIYRHAHDVAFLVPAAHGRGDTRSRSLEEPLPAQTARQTEALAVPSPLVGANRTNNLPAPITRPAPSIVTSGSLYLAVPAPFIVVNNRGAISHTLDETLNTIKSRDGQALAVPPAFLASYYRTLNIRGVDKPMPTIPCVDRHALVEATSIDVNECGYRMVEPKELKLGQGFPPSYLITAKAKRDQVWLIGNANPPKTMKWIIGRCLETLR